MDTEIIYYCFLAGILGGTVGCTLYSLIYEGIRITFRKTNATDSKVRRAALPFMSDSAKPISRVVRRADDVLWAEEQQERKRKL